MNSSDGPAVRFTPYALRLRAAFAGSQAPRHVQDYKQLRCWKAAQELARELIPKTEAFPVETRFGMASQIRNAAVSIPANIAEGCGRDSDRAFANHVRIALGSAFELESLLFLSGDLGYLSRPDTSR